MNQLEKNNLIKENILDQGFYYQSLFEEACRMKLLHSSQIERIQIELIELLGKEVERYTNGESSSVPVEKAQEILRSITYCLGVYFKSMSNMDERIEKLKTEKIRDQFYRGMNAVSEIKTKTEKLLKDLQRDSLKVSNIAFNDTLYTGIPEFFPNYNIEFAADDMPGSIDYPLLETITNLLGVEYLYAYLHRLTIENEFIIHFTEHNVAGLLHGFHKDSDHMLINLFEVVLTNAIGCELSGANITDLDITKSDSEWLTHNLRKLSNKEIEGKINTAIENIAEKLNLGVEITSYAKLILPDLTSRIKNNLETDTLDQLFISFETEKNENDFFEEGIEMENEKLRIIIDELTNMKTIQEKMLLIRKTVQSTYDFIELLEECFYDNEYQEVLQMLNVTERNVLKNRILDDACPEGETDYEPEKEWQRILFRL